MLLEALDGEGFLEEAADEGGWLPLASSWLILFLLAETMRSYMLHVA